MTVFIEKYSMFKKEFIRIINEEISGFDFLGNKEYLEEQEDIELLENGQFQKQFIIDSITKMRQKIKADNSDISISNDPELDIDNNHDDLNIDANIDVTYQYDPDKNPLKFFVSFNGKRVNYSTNYESDSQTYDYPGYFKSWYESIDWGDIAVELYSTEGDKINFSTFEKSPQQIQDLFVRAYLEGPIADNTDVGDVKEKKPQYNPF